MATVRSLKLVIVTEVVLSAPVCRCIDTAVVCVVMSLAEQFQPVVAAGKVTVQADPGVVPTPILKAAVPLFAKMDAAAPPHPAAAMVGVVALIIIFRAAVPRAVENVNIVEVKPAILAPPTENCGEPPL